MTRHMWRQITVLGRRSAWAALLLLPLGAILVLAASGAGADTTQLPQSPVLPSPFTGFTDGQNGATVGAPGGQNGGSVSSRPCTAPCTSTVGSSQGPQPAGVGFRSGQGASGSGDDSPAQGNAPYAYGNGRAGEGASGSMGPSGGSYQGTGCVSVNSLVPIPVNVNGTGFSCPPPSAFAGEGGGAPSGSGAGGSSAGSGGAAGSPASGAGNANAASGTGSGANGGSAGNGGSSGGGVALCPTKPAGQILTPNQIGGPLGLLIVALIALATGYLLSATRRRLVAY